MQAIETDIFDNKKYQQFIRNNIRIPKDTSCTERVIDIIFRLIKD